MKYAKNLLIIVALAAAVVFYAQKPAGATLSIVGTPTAVTMTLTAADITAGYYEKTADIGTYATKLTVTDSDPSSGIYWNIKAKCATANFTALNGGVKACSALKFRMNGTGAYTSLATTDTVLTDGSGTADANVDFKFTTSIYDKADTYSMSVVFTVAQIF